MIGKVMTLLIILALTAISTLIRQLALTVTLLMAHAHAADLTMTPLLSQAVPIVFPVQMGSRSTLYMTTVLGIVFQKELQQTLLLKAIACIHALSAVGHTMTNKRQPHVRHRAHPSRWKAHRVIKAKVPVPLAAIIRMVQILVQVLIVLHAMR